DLKKFIRGGRPTGLAARRADRRVMLLANTPGIRFVPFLALGPSGGQRKPVISVNRPWVATPAAAPRVRLPVPSGMVRIFRHATATGFA
ncbi:hypothetical protein, partial [Burkholderia ubonensis]|uniref:hypothetical protein n=1 Tax=Burkholderia ubonensis TaxID=101571 RepID=UPI001E3A202B